MGPGALRTRFAVPWPPFCYPTDRGSCSVMERPPRLRRRYSELPRRPCASLPESRGITDTTAGDTSTSGGRRGLNLMECLKEIPTLKGDNYTVWRNMIDLIFVWGEVDWVLSTPQPIAPERPVRAIDDTDEVWKKKEWDHVPIEFAYILESNEWNITNKKCMFLVRKSIEPTILDSITECDSVAEFLQKIKTQFSDSTEIYPKQLIMQCLHCKKKGHYKEDCSDWLKWILFQNGISLDEENAKSD